VKRINFWLALILVIMAGDIAYAAFIWPASKAAGKISPFLLVMVIYYSCLAALIFFGKKVEKDAEKRLVR